MLSFLALENREGVTSWKKSAIIRVSFKLT